MKCPICGQELRPGKKDPNYLLCYNCKKKFKAPQNKTVKKAQEDQKYSNIPSKQVREKRENEMRKAYDDMLAVDDGRKKKLAKPKRQEVYDDDYYGDDEDEKTSKLPIIILAVAIVAVGILIAVMLLL